MYAISLHVEGIRPVPVVTECYTSEIMSDELLRLNNGNVLCLHCQDNDWIRAAQYTVRAEYMDWDNQVHSYINRVCSQHLIAETENFRDLGK